MCQPESRFYLKPLKIPTSDSWFSRQPLGKNSIGNMAKTMSLKAGFASGNKTNHSGRKTAIQTLLHAGIPPTNVMQITGHKNVQSLNSYSHLSEEQQQSISNLLTDHVSKATGQPPAATSVSNPQIPDSDEAPTPTSVANFSLQFELDDDTINQLLDDPPFDEMAVLSDPSGTSLTTNVSENPCYMHSTGHDAGSNRVPLGYLQLPLHPYGQQSQRYQFLNGEIHGNVAIHFHEHFGSAAKRCRLQVVQDSDGSEE